MPSKESETQELTTTTTSPRLRSLASHEILKSVHVGNLIALKIEKYREELPQIGKVVAIDEASVTVNWLIGSYSGIFTYWKERGEIIQEVFPLRGVICPIKLSPSMRLAKVDSSTLKEIYVSSEFV